MNLQKVPTVTKQTFREMEDMSRFTSALIFDDLLIVAQKQTNCFVLNTAQIGRASWRERVYVSV